MVHIPAGPVEKTLRPPREMMKNVTGSSAGVSFKQTTEQVFFSCMMLTALDIVGSLSARRPARVNSTFTSKIVVANTSD